MECTANARHDQSPWNEPVVKIGRKEIKEIEKLTEKNTMKKFIKKKEKHHK
jgi:hypothetical protein